MTTFSEFDEMTVNVLYEVTYYDWKANGNYSIGDEINQAYSSFKAIGLMFQTYEVAIATIGCIIKTQYPSGGNMTMLSPLFYNG